MMASTEDKWDEMSKIFNTCTPIQSKDDVTHMYGHYSNGYAYMSMTDYPYPAAFLEPMPAWPVAESVKPWVNIPTVSELTEPIQEVNSGLSARETQLYEALAESTNVYFNYTG